MKKRTFGRKHDLADMARDGDEVFEESMGQFKQAQIDLFRQIDRMKPMMEKAGLEILDPEEYLGAVGADIKALMNHDDQDVLAFLSQLFFS